MSRAPLLFNLISNARDAIPQRGKITIRIGHGKKPKPLSRPNRPLTSWICFEVVDNGVGIEPQVIEKIFEPFFSTKPTKGSGLGLATVYGLVVRCGGVVEVDSAPNKGTTIRCIVPCLQQHYVQKTTNKDPRSQKKLNLAVIDNASTIRSIVCDLLQKQGHSVTEYHSREHALKHINLFKEIDLVVAASMPGFKTWQFIEHLEEQCGTLPCIILAGQHTAGLKTFIKNEPHRRLLQKPFTNRQFQTTVHELLDQLGFLNSN